MHVSWKTCRLVALTIFVILLLAAYLYALVKLAKPSKRFFLPLQILFIIFSIFAVGYLTSHLLVYVLLLNSTEEKVETWLSQSAKRSSSVS